MNQYLSKKFRILTKIPYFDETLIAVLNKNYNQCTPKEKQELSKRLNNIKLVIERQDVFQPLQNQQTFFAELKQAMYGKSTEQEYKKSNFCFYLDFFLDLAQGLSAYYSGNEYPLYNGIQLIKGSDTQIAEFRLLIKYITNMYYDGEEFSAGSKELIQLQNVFRVKPHERTREFQPISSFKKRSKQHFVRHEFTKQEKDVLMGMDAQKITELQFEDPRLQKLATGLVDSLMGAEMVEDAFEGWDADAFVLQLVEQVRQIRAMHEQMEILDKIAQNLESVPVFDPVVGQMDGEKESYNKQLVVDAQIKIVVTVEDKPEKPQIKGPQFVDPAALFSGNLAFVDAAPAEFPPIEATAAGFVYCGVIYAQAELIKLFSKGEVPFGKATLTPNGLQIRLDGETITFSASETEFREIEALLQRYFGQEIEMQEQFSKEKDKLDKQFSDVENQFEKKFALQKEQLKLANQQLDRCSEELKEKTKNNHLLEKMQKLELEVEKAKSDFAFARMVNDRNVQHKINQKLTQLKGEVENLQMKIKEINARLRGM